VQRPQIPQELHDANPVHEALSTPDPDFPGSITVLTILADDAEQKIEAGILES
jgi:hypothetical protein